MIFRFPSTTRSMQKLLPVFLLFISLTAFAQKKDQSKWVDYEQQLRESRQEVIDAENSDLRLQRNEQFIKLLRYVIRQRPSYEYAFDSIPFVGVIESPDKKFRLFNWNVPLDNDENQYFGFIQYKTKVGMKLIELIDTQKEQFISEHKAYTAEKWYGALYYQIIPTKCKNQTYYTLLGWDGCTKMSNKKIIEAMYFTGSGKVKFGATIFKMEHRPQRRVVLEYSEEAMLTLDYYPKKDRIVFDHLIPMRSDLESIREYYVPDGSYDALIYDGDGWVFSDDVDARVQKSEAPYSTPAPPDPTNLNSSERRENR